MAEILDVKDATTPSQDGWLVYYKVKREDGQAVTVEAHGTGSAEVTAQSSGNEEAIAYIRDRGSMAAVKYAERAQSPEERGNTLIRLSIDPLNGGLRVEYEYETPSKGLDL